jgi:putative phosphoesterase
MLIAVIADTHGKLPAPIIEPLSHAAEIWHLGDFCDLRTLAAVRAIGPPVFAVAGNNDFGLDLPPVLTLTREGHRFTLIHIPPRRIASTEFLLHGHTHVPRDEMIGDTRVLNPGTVGKPNKGAAPSWAWLLVQKGRPVRWTIQKVPENTPSRSKQSVA